MIMRQMCCFYVKLIGNLFIESTYLLLSFSLADCFVGLFPRALDAGPTLSLLSVAFLYAQEKTKESFIKKINNQLICKQ